MDFASVALTLAKPAVQLTLKELASRKRAQFDDIVGIFKRQNPDTAQQEATSSLQDLKELRLIDEQKGVLPRWTTYYVTAEGLEATRKLTSQ